MADAVPPLAGFDVANRFGRTRGRRRPGDERSLGEVTVRLILPGAAPGILGSFRAGLGMGWMTVVAAELFGIVGIGSRMNEAAGLLATEVVIVYMLTIAFLYAVSDILFVKVRDRLLQWQQ